MHNNMDNTDHITKETFRRQMAIKNYVSNNFLSMLVDSFNVLDCHLSGVFPHKSNVVE